MDRVRKSLQLDKSILKERGTWSGQFDFLLSCIGYAVGLGTIWRFPYLCYRNGGGAFLIPYVIYLFLVGMPLVLLELAYGQFSSLSPIEVWKMSPLFQGVGFGMVIISGIVCVYYNVIIAWTLYYFVQCFTWDLPWRKCGNPWNSELCADGRNETIVNNVSVKGRSPSEEFFERYILGMSDGIDNIGTPRWQLVVALFVAWVFIFLALFKGVKSSGKVVYVTATLPYILLFALLVRAVTLEGSYEGIKRYLLPDMAQLAQFGPWGDAAMQLFYSMGAAWGALVTLSSYNKFNNNFYRDAVILAITDTFTAFLAGLVIFATLGFMAHETNSPISSVVTDGPGLVFIVYPAAIARMPLAPLWAVLFFIFLFTVGVDSQFGMFETVLSALFDRYPYLRNKKILVTALLSVVEFLFGLLLVCNVVYLLLIFYRWSEKGGIYFFQIMDWYSSTFSLMILSLTECFVISWIYGIDRFYFDMTMMLGFRPCRWWGVLWKFITPVLIAFIFLVAVIKHTPVTYGAYTYPPWAIGLGWLFAVCSILPIPVVAFVKIACEEGPVLERVKRLVRPAEDWGPSRETGRHEEYQRIQQQMEDRCRRARWQAADNHVNIET